MKFNHLLWEYLFSFFSLYNFTIASQSVLIKISFLGIINILKLSIAYVMANIFVRPDKIPISGKRAKS